MDKTRGIAENHWTLRARKVPVLVLVALAHIVGVGRAFGQSDASLAPMETVVIAREYIIALGAGFSAADGSRLRGVVDAAREGAVDRFWCGE